MTFDPWTLGLQAVNFLVLVWLLHRFLYRPVLGILATRKATVDKLTADAGAAKAAAEAVRLDLESQRAAVAQDRDATVKAAREAADAEGKAILAKAHADAKALKSEVKTTFERERAALAETAGRDAARLAVAIVRRLLKEPASVAVQDRLLDLVCDDVKALPADAKMQFAKRVAARDETPEVVTAAPLDARAAKRFAEHLAKALGAPASPVFRVDPKLLAGVEVHFPFTILRRSWSDDLKRIEAELIHDEQASNLA